MIETISVTAIFDGPIKTWSFAGSFSPPPGITAVVGRNGSGKSLLALETPRYLLFGKKALRGAAGDYRSYAAEGVFNLNGTRVEIKRSPKREQLIDLETGTIEAVGAEAVTAKVVELLGYGLDVFDLANAAVQKKTDRLGQLRPAERKELIDRVVGLSSYETIEKACCEEAKKLKSHAEGLAMGNAAPTPALPRPEGFMASKVVEVTIKRETASRRKFDALSSKLSVPVQVVSQPVGKRITQEEVDALAQQHAEAAATARERARLTAITGRAMLTTDATEESICAGERVHLWKEDVRRRGPRPVMTQAEVTAGVEAWAAVAAARRLSNEQATCPECGHEFRVGGKIPSSPDCELVDYQAQQKAIDAWAFDLGDQPEGEAIDPAQAARLRRAIQMHREFDEAQAELAKLPRPGALPSLDEARAGLAAWFRYDAALEAFDLAVERARAAQAELDLWLTENEKPLEDADIDELHAQLAAARAYENSVEVYEVNKKRYDEAVIAIAELERRAAAYRDGASALGDARATFKAHLAPTLSRISSSLIHDMSAGELTSVVVDEEMNITVDGQKIETLSGAGETVANLALRIAFGQALVADAFPVFLGDEIDSDADEQRRAATKQALLALKSRLSQIILITHRAVDVADLVIDLDNPQEV